MTLSLVALLLLTSPAAKPGTALPVEQGPLDFRCDSMRVFSKPNRTVCQNNVVIRRGNLLVCCQTFEGFADEQWEWQRFVCNTQARAQRGVETAWADKAEFVQENGNLVLTGSPVMHRGQSMLEGDRIVIDVREDRARVDKPRGRVDPEESRTISEALKQAPPPAPGPLPERCPIPPLPRK